MPGISGIDLSLAILEPLTLTKPAMTRSKLILALLASLALATSLSARADEESSASTPLAATDAQPASVVVVGSPESKTTQSNDSQSWYSSAWDTAGQHLSDIWNKGDIEVYVPFWSYHLPFAYSADKRSSYTEYPAGGGLGKGWYNASGNWEGIYAMEFQDSHGKPMYMGGYGWIPTWRPINDDFKIGAGLTAFMFMRSDIGNYAPIPGILPAATIGYGPVDVQVAYIPGGQGNGNVLFWWAKYSFR